MKKDTGFATWQATIKEVQDGSMFNPSSVMLSAYGFYDGTERDADGRTTKGDICALLSLTALVSALGSTGSQAVLPAM